MAFNEVQKIKLVQEDSSKNLCRYVVFKTELAQCLQFRRYHSI